MKDSNNRSTDLLVNVGRLITSSLDLREILNSIMHEVRLYFKPQNWSLLRFDEASQELIFLIIEGISPRKVENVVLKPGEGVAGYVVQTGKQVFVPDTSVDSHFSSRIDKITGFSTKSIIAVPIKMQDRVYGVIEIINREEDDAPFTSEDCEILQAVASFSAIAFANHSAYELALNQSEIDHLTGLYNLCKLEAVFKESISGVSPHRRRSDKKTEIIAVYIDLDFFKEVNDRYGHAEGDEVLKKVAMRLRSLFRSDDLIFRMGGDEFLVLIQLDASLDVKAIIERIEHILGEIEITSMKKGYTVKFSYGITHGSPENIRELIHSADLIMYENKKDRR